VKILSPATTAPVSSKVDSSLPSCSEQLFNEGDFVLLRLETNVRKKIFHVFYIGQVISAAGPKMWRIRCMRRYKNSYCQFIFPQTDDINIYLSDEIIKILTDYKLVRYVHHFADDFSPYIHGLRLMYTDCNMSSGFF
jgi:hypothetical protein